MERIIVYRRPVLILAALAATAASALGPRRQMLASQVLAAPHCTLVPGRTLALLRVERETTLAFTPVDFEAMSASSVPRSADDSLLATKGSPMPAARVRVLGLDSVTRAAFRRAGITDDQPTAFIQAAPYRADCQPVRWTGNAPWTRAGDLGFARATLAPPERWIRNIPVLVIPDAWSYPYPRQRGLAYHVPADAPLAPADALYSLQITLEAPYQDGAEWRGVSSDTLRARTLKWARSHPAAAELEPVRSEVQDAVLQADWPAVERVPSRLRGSYRVTVEAAGVAGTWYFRTNDRPGYQWREAESSRSVADLLASPHAAGYLLVGYAAATRTVLPRGSQVERNPALVWLAAADRPTVAGNDQRRELRGELMFMLRAVPAPLWDHLESLVPQPDALERNLFGEFGLARPRAERQPRLALTFRIDSRGGVRADTSLTSRGRTLRVSLERLDITSVPRQF